MADEDREGSPGRAVLDLERSDVVQMMKEAGLDTPTAFFNTIEGKEVDEKELTKVFTERNYFASNGASLEYE
eukprot:1006607-Rhodomonas_salina.1